MTKKQRIKLAAELMYEGAKFSCVAISKSHPTKYSIYDPLREEYLLFLGVSELKALNDFTGRKMRSLALLFFAESL